MQTYKICQGTMLTVHIYLIFLPIAQNEVPFMNTSEVTEKVEWPNRERQRGKEYAFSWVFRATGVVQTHHNFWISGDTMDSSKCTVGNAITCNQIKTSFPIRKQIYGCLLLFMEFLYLISVVNLFWSCVKHFQKSCGFWHSVCFSI